MKQLTISRTTRSEAEIEDLSEQPMTKEELAMMTRRPRIFTLRRALGLTQEEFSARFAIPLGTLRDWEQRRSAPDAMAQAYLKVIAADPESLAKAVGKSAA
jgi:putative transcriptional regulator